MKIRILFILFFVSIVSKAQQSDLNNSGQGFSYKPNNDLHSLAKKLTDNEKTETAKVRSIFRWITENIDYRVGKVHNKRIVQIEGSTDTTALKSLDERVAENVFLNRLAVCDGYSRLFKTLCDYAGIEARVITGYGRVTYGRTGSKFRSNHTWNAVRIDSVWHLLDVTWASGHLTWNGGEYVRRYDGRYFLTDPKTFIHDHYPDDLRWTLIDDPPVMGEYRNSPYKLRAFIKYRISSIAPSKGVIAANVGDTLQFLLETKDFGKDTLVSADPFLDTSALVSPRVVVLSPQINERRSFSYQYVLSSTDVQWIYLMYNGDVVLRYRVHIRDRLASK